MWTTFCTWVATKIGPKVGWLIGIIFARVGSDIAKDLANELYNKKAYEFVKELSKRNDLTGFQKAAEFNKKFTEWLAISGKVLATSVINLLRELAYNALVTQNESIKK